MDSMLEQLAPRLQEYCRTRPIERLAVFGSIARGGADESSDLDLLVTLRPGLSHSEIFRLAGEIESMAGRRVDFVVRDALERTRNSFKRDTILRTAVTVYER